MNKFVIALSIIVASMLYAQTRAAVACSTNADCPGGCCAYTRTGHVCKSLGKKGDVCDLEGKGLAKDVCVCETGMTCVKIDLSVLGDKAGQINVIFERHHYGLCDTNPIG
ncbi:uncharacterized protein LOC118477592 [Aplysia californica]|uniref:Uncharacterized protein LOC118477592 n=1 Tax=Aplysia californica TaxID=6500 RepID=A0ABM1VSG7_APLCA|nr:uncharacterized protein LOC118477592 [Aplysia californica]